MFDFLRKFVGLPEPKKAFFSPAHGEQATNAHLEVFAGDDAGDLALTRYPPFDQGIPLINIETLLKSQEELISRIFRTAGVSREEFDLRFEPAIRNLALHVHLLPATATTYFRGTGGLFRMSLEVALNALQTANASVFPISGGVERRFYIQPKWSLAVFLAGLCSQLYRTFNSMVVISRDNQQWTSLLDHLYDWAVESKINRYHVRWLEDAPIRGAQSSGSSGMNHIVPREVLQYLASDNNQIFPAMTSAISGVDYATSENPIARIIAPIITRVIEEDLKRTATNYGHLVIGTHLEPHLLDAMRRLVRSGKWAPNQPGGRLWIGREGTFIDWIEAASDIALLMEKDAFAGVPKDPDTLAEILVNAGMLEMNKGDERYWTIALPVSLEARDTTVKLGQGVSILPEQYDLEQFQNVQLTLKPPPVRAPQKPKPRETQATKPEPRLEAAKPIQQIVSREAPIETPAHSEELSDDELVSYSEDADPPSEYFPQEFMSENNAPPEELIDSKPVKAAVPRVTQAKTPDRKKTDVKDGREPIHESKIDSKPVLQKQTSTSSSKNEVIDDVASDRLFASLKPDNSAALRSVINKARTIENSGVAIYLPYGVGITHRALVAEDHQVSEIIQELAAKQWLWVDKTKPSKKIHAVDVDGEVLSLMILKTDIASGLGLCKA